MAQLFKGTGIVASSDYKALKWIGHTAGGSAIEINFTKAINLGNIDWTFAEKDDVVAEAVFTAVYNNSDTMIDDGVAAEEPWSVKYSPSGQAESASKGIMLGAGKFSIGGTDIALTRGGGKFTVERTFREINADGDRGPVEGRIVMDGARATLTLNSLQIITRMADLYAGITATTTT